MRESQGREVIRLWFAFQERGQHGGGTHSSATGVMFGNNTIFRGKMGLSRDLSKVVEIKSRSKDRAASGPHTGNCRSKSLPRFPRSLQAGSTSGDIGKHTEFLFYTAKSWKLTTQAGHNWKMSDGVDGR